MELTLTEIIKLILLLLLVICAVSVNFTKSLLQAVIIFLSYSSVNVSFVDPDGIPGPRDYGSCGGSRRERYAVSSDSPQDPLRA